MAPQGDPIRKFDLRRADRSRSRSARRASIERRRRRQKGGTAT